MGHSPLDVLGIGNAIVDVLATGDDRFLAAHGLVKGAMTLVDGDRGAAIYAAMGPGVEVSGGSAANTIAGFAAFGGAAGFIGKVRDDQLGEVFAHDLRAQGVAFATPPAIQGPATARCLIVVTPDAQRTMSTYLGASVDLGPDDVEPGQVAAARIVYLEGYLWDPPKAKQAFLKAAEIAHAAGARVALSLSDAFCVERHKAEFQDLVARHVDILFANEAELIALTDAASFDAAVALVRGRCAIAAVTRGAHGSVIATAEMVIPIAAEQPARLVDSTGAGDLYAAGVLFGLARGADLATAGRLGSLAAAEIISHLGARPETSLRELARAISPAVASR